MERICVEAKRCYDVVISGDYNLLCGEVKKVFHGKKIAVLTDGNTSPLFYKEVEKRLIGYDICEICVAAGEKSKSEQTYFKVLNTLAELSFTRNDCLLTLGGGVVGDLGGFVASTYMRGVTYIQCPTTLLADVDSSVGGKTAVNLAAGKNLVGTFYQPSLVYINTECLKTLPKKEIDCGMGEVIKYAFLSGDFSEEELKEKSREKLIAKCVKIKADFVKKDEFDLGNRAMLNLGHTIGHAIENLSGYSLPHGLCVAKGISRIIDLSAHIYRLDDNTVLKMKELLGVWEFDLSIPYSADEICDKILLDKKAVSGGVNFILLKGIGKPTIEKLSEEDIRRLVGES